VTLVTSSYSLGRANRVCSSVYKTSYSCNKTVGKLSVVGDAEEGVVVGAVVGDACLLGAVVGGACLLGAVVVAASCVGMTEKGGRLCEGWLLGMSDMFPDFLLKLFPLLPLFFFLLAADTTGVKRYRNKTGKTPMIRQEVLSNPRFALMVVAIALQFR